MNQVKELRERAGMQQKEVAIAVGVSRPTVSEWEHQKKDPSGYRLLRIAEIFHVTTGVVLGYDPIPKGDGIFYDVPDEERELLQARQALRVDPNRRALMDLATNGSAQDVRQVAALIDALRATNPDFYDGDDQA